MLTVALDSQFLLTGYSLSEFVSKRNSNVNVDDPTNLYFVPSGFDGLRALRLTEKKVSSSRISSEDTRCVTLPGRRTKKLEAAAIKA